ncbi:MAG: hypothetical protein QXR39_09320, partial [Candidatus Methanomethylicia archaeon]
MHYCNIFNMKYYNIFSKNTKVNIPIAIENNVIYAITSQKTTSSSDIFHYYFFLTFLNVLARFIC